jgi:septal ring factor EnvC (AmiA/AmiB activator)
MSQGHDDLVRALDPLAEDGAVARFLRSLREELKGADEDRAEQLSTALAALDANDENSLLSRLVRETHRARVEVLTAVNPDAPSSPMAILKTSLTKLLEEQTATQTALANQQQVRQTQFEKEVREALVRIETKRTQDQKTTRGGFDFEDAVISFVRSATQGAPCIFDVTGAIAGVGRCKKGDAVLRFTDESAFAGAGVVFEAKRDATYTVQKAIDELDAARKNRGAIAGVFVMARSHASDVFPRFARYGNNVIMTWDDQDPATDAYLHAAVLLGMALVTRSRTTGDAGDIAALRDVEARIEAELSRLEKMETHSTAIRRSADGLSEEIRKAQRALDLLLRKAQRTLQALNVELHDEGAERCSPIALPNDSFEAGILALPTGGEAA